MLCNSMDFYLTYSSALWYYFYMIDLHLSLDCVLLEMSVSKSVTHSASVMTPA